MNTNDCYIEQNNEALWGSAYVLTLAALVKGGIVTNEEAGALDKIFGGYDFYSGFSLLTKDKWPLSSLIDSLAKKNIIGERRIDGQGPDAVMCLEINGKVLHTQVHKLLLGSREH